MTENKLKYSKIARLPTAAGEFKACCVLEPGNGKEHLLIYQGELENAEHLIFRIHSECLTSEVFGSLKCDCRDQLNLAMKAIAEHGRGAVLYLRQEGRGIGLFNKIEAYSLQDVGFNTIEANLELGFGVDLRDYGVAAAVLKDFDVKSIRLASNNPLKIEAMRMLGIEIAELMPVKSRANPHNKGYLEVKRELMDHAI